MAIQRFAAASVLAAAFCLPAVPAAAAGLPGAADGAQGYDSSAETAHQSRSWGASHDDEGYYSDNAYAPRERDDRYNDDARWAAADDRQAESYPAGERALGLDRVAQTCVRVVERERDRVNAVEGLTRDTSGWSVSGSLHDGSGFSCRIGTDGQLQDVHFGRERAPEPARFASPARPEPAGQPEPRAAALAAPPPPPTLGDGGEILSSAIARPPEATAAPSLAAMPPAPVTRDDSAYHVAKLPPPPEIPQSAGLAGGRELPGQPAAGSAAAADAAGAPAAAGALQPAGEAPQAKAEDDDGPLPPADTSEARAVDPDQSPVAANAGQSKDDGRYSASQAPDFSQAI